MKYLKLFDGIKWQYKVPDKKEFYYKVSSEVYYTDIFRAAQKHNGYRISKISLNELLKYFELKDFTNVKSRDLKILKRELSTISWRNFNDIYIELSFDEIKPGILSDNHYTQNTNIILRIRETKDEWFLVECYDSYASENITYYECDQINGVIKLIDDILILQ